MDAIETIFEVALLASGVVLLFPVTTFFLECAWSVLPQRTRAADEPAKSPRVAVLIPAHDEESVIGKTLTGLLPTLGKDDWALVVADNCSDETAGIARAAGARVVERADDQKRGKGYALDCGVRHLEADPPDVVVVLDADCDVELQTIRTIATLAHNTGQPAQALNLGEFDRKSDAVYVVSALANRFTNLIRPLGVTRMGLPYRLMGTGMAIPWPIMKTASLAVGNLVEDTRLGIDLAIEGHNPLFERSVRVTSRLPQQSGAFQSQRTRWEHGHLQTALREVPRLVRTTCREDRPELLWMALDLCVPPLALLALLWSAVTLLSVVVWLLGASGFPMFVLMVEGAMLASAVVVGWAAHCRHEIPLSALGAVPKYVWRKIPIYWGFLFRRQQDWVRTAREPLTDVEAS